MLHRLQHRTFQTDTIQHVPTPFRLKMPSFKFAPVWAIDWTYHALLQVKWKCKQGIFLTEPEGGFEWSTVPAREFSFEREHVFIPVSSVAAFCFCVPPSPPWKVCSNLRGGFWSGLICPKKGPTREWVNTNLWESWMQPSLFKKWPNFLNPTKRLGKGFCCAPLCTKMLRWWGACIFFSDDKHDINQEAWMIVEGKEGQLVKFKKKQRCSLGIKKMEFYFCFLHRPNKAKKKWSKNILEKRF